MPKKASSSLRISLLVAVIALLFFYLPYPVLLVSSITPIKIYNWKIWLWYMDFRRSFRADRDALPLPEIDLKDLNKEAFMKLSKDLSSPLVVRGLIPAHEKLGNASFWYDNYGNSSISCSDRSDSKLWRCKMKDFIEQSRGVDEPLYSRSNHGVLYNNPELLNMLTNPVSEWLSPNPLYEAFFGFVGGGSCLHAAFGTNIVKQITGRKKWVLASPLEMPYMNIYLSDAGVVFYPIDKNTYIDAPFLRKVNRFETVLNPGDGMFIPAMWLHSVENIPPEEGTALSDTSQEMIVACPERHFGVQFGWKTSWFLTSQLIARRVLGKMYRKVVGSIPRKKVFEDLIPVRTAAEAEAFDEYIFQMRLPIEKEEMV